MKHTEEIDKLLAEQEPLIEGFVAMVNPPPDSVITLQAGQNLDAVSQAEAALLPSAERLGIFQRAGEIVRAFRLPEPRKGGGLKRPAGMMLLKEPTPVAIAGLFESVAIFQRFKKTTAGKPSEPYPVDCPRRLAELYLAQAGNWRLSVLTGIIFCPLMRREGTILDRPGFDEETGLLFDSNEEWPPIPDRPTHEDAKNALQTFLEPLAEFTFCTPSDRAVQASAMLTGIQRRILQAAPLHANSAPGQREGKSLLAEITAIVATGKPAAATGVSPKREEIRKAITSALREGHAIVNLDNVDGVLDSPDLARAITQPEYGDRLLGENKMLYLPTNVLWTATGVNLTVRSDLTSRTLMCKIEAGVERPEERTFKIPDLKAYVTEHRKEIVAAGITILRAYHVAGSPPQEAAKPWGGFDDWSRHIREPLMWAGMADPCRTRENVIADDPALEQARVVLHALQDAFSDNGFTIREVVERCDKRLKVKQENGEESIGDFEHAELRTIMLGIARDKNDHDLIDPSRLGYWCRDMNRRILNGLRVVKAGNRKAAALWKIENVGGR